MEKPRCVHTHVVHDAETFRPLWWQALNVDWIHLTSSFCMKTARGKDPSDFERRFIISGKQAEASVVYCSNGCNSIWTVTNVMHRHLDLWEKSSRGNCDIQQGETPESKGVNEFFFINSDSSSSCNINDRIALILVHPAVVGLVFHTTATFGDVLPGWIHH